MYSEFLSSIFHILRLVLLTCVSRHVIILNLTLLVLPYDDCRLQEPADILFGYYY